MSTVVAAAEARCHYCQSLRPVSELIQPFAYGTAVGRVVCKDGDACIGRLDAGSLPARPEITAAVHEDRLAVPPMNPDPLAYLPEPISGRSVPRPAPLPPDFRHDMRLWGLDAGIILASCAPCAWSTQLESGHTVGDLVRLERQHAGVEDPVPS